MTEDQTPAEPAGDEEVLDKAPEPIEEKGQEEDQPAEAETEEDTDEAKDEEKSRSKARRERRKAEQERLRQSEAAAKAELAQMEAKLERIRKTQQGLQPPKEADYSDFAEYQAALAAFRAVEALDKRAAEEIGEEAETRKKEVDRIEEQRRQEVAQHWRDQVSEAMQRYTDYEQVAFTVPLTKSMEDLVLASDEAPDVLYYLGQHRNEAASIATMSDLDAARAIGRIEARLSAPKPRLTTEAPEPISPVRGKASGSKDPEKMTFAEYKAARMAGKI